MQLPTLQPGRDVSTATGKTAVLPRLFSEEEGQAQNGFELGGRLLTNPDSGDRDDVEGAELELRFLH